MSDIDDPFAARPDATVVRPRPGAGRPGSAGAPPPRVPRPAPGGVGRPEREGRSLPAVERVSDASAPGLNPLVQAAGPALILAGHLRGTLSAPDVAGLRRLALDEIRRFEERARAGGLAQDTVLAARYVLCAALDEAALSTPWGAQSEWSHQTLLVALHRETWGGEKFFEMLDRVGEDPARHLDLMELQYLCVAFGFAGKYQVNERGRAQLADVQRAVYRKIRDQRGAPRTELSLRWEGVRDRRNPLIRYVPWWVAGAACLAVVLVAYVVYFGALRGRTGSVEAAISRIGGESPPPPAAARGADTLRQLLLQSGAPRLTVIEDGGRTRVRIDAPNMFGSGKVDLQPEYEAVLKPLADALMKIGGRVTVEGHTDATPLSLGSPFTSNRQLSMERAKSVVGVLTKLGVKDLTPRGLGDGSPLLPDDRNNARNRRVEIVHEP